MKFIHIADTHFDSQFLNLSDIKNEGDKRRLEQRRGFKQIIDYIKQNDIEYFFIAGDLYEQKYIRATTIKYIDDLFREIPNTKIYITPGNHDPKIVNSFYNKYEWSSNVHIFSNSLELIENEVVDIYGIGFEDFYLKNDWIQNLEIKNQNKINILITHGDLNASVSSENSYNPIKLNDLAVKGFDYVALGHIHKKDIATNIVYPGSTFSLGFDELGEHGMLVVSLTKDKLEKEFIKIDSNEFVEKEFDVTNIVSKEELIEKINDMYFDSKVFVKLILIGRRNFQIDVLEIYKLIDNKQILKIKDTTKMNYDLEKISNNVTLRGIFARMMQEKLNNAKNDEEKELIEKAIEIGLDSME